MDTTDNPAGPEVSIESRLAAALSPEAAPEQEAPAEVDVEPAPVEAEAEGEEQPSDDSVDWQDDDGTVYKVPAALKDKIPLRADYTRKTQQAATLAEAAHDRLQYAEAREQFVTAVMQDVAELKSMQSQLKQYDGIDLSQLYSSDPGTALRIRDQREDLRRQIGDMERQIGGKAQSLESMTQQHNSKQWQMAVEGVQKRLGTVSPADDVAMLHRAREIGFSEKELKGRYADPRILELIHDSAKLKQIQSGRASALQTAQKAPPVLKPGAVNQSAAVSKEKALRQQLKKSGDYRDAARLLIARGI